jgi:hypothetical protein
MEPSFQPTNLNPEAIRKIGLRLYGAEKFQADPATVILNTIAWVDAVPGDAETQPFSQRQDAKIAQLAEVVRVNKGSSGRRDGTKGQRGRAKELDFWILFTGAQQPGKGSKVSARP